LSNNNTSVFGIYTDRHEVEEAISLLRLEGFRTSDLSVLFPDTKAPLAMTASARAGSALSLLAGIGALAVPGFGSFVAAGPVIGALAGAASDGAVGGVAGGLIGLGMPEGEARRYEGRIREGGILISVNCDDAAWMRNARIILENTGAEDVASTAEARAFS